MSTRNAVYRCELCGNMIEMLAVGGGQLVCCDQPMSHQAENTTDAAVEKHVPVIEKVDGGYRVSVGSVLHPMADAHLIQWIDLITGDVTLRQFLKAGDAPVATFTTDAQDVAARAYCNLHGFWKA